MSATTAKRGRPPAATGETKAIHVPEEIARMIAVIASARGCYQRDYLTGLITEAVNRDYDEAVRTLSR